MNDKNQIVVLSTIELFFVIIIIQTVSSLSYELQVKTLSMGLKQDVTFFSIVVLLLMSILVETQYIDQNLGCRGVAVKSIIILVLCAATLYFVDLVITNDTKLVLPLLTIFTLAHFMTHVLYKVAVEALKGPTKVLILGSGPIAQCIYDLINKKCADFILVGQLKTDKNDTISSKLCFNNEGFDLLSVVRYHEADLLVFSLPDRRGVLSLREVMKCKSKGIKIVDATTFYEHVSKKILIESTTPGWFVHSLNFQSKGEGKIITRFFDITLSACVMIVALPLLLIIALAIKLDSAGPIFFKQERIGKGEAVFTLYKFRTMTVDAEKETGAVWALENDSRITLVGNWLRKRRLDELPQFLNVIKGDMSIVGPRPERKVFVEILTEIIPFYTERHFVKPGITGWAQVSYAYGASAADAIEKLRYDLYYIKNASLLFDLVIIWKTLEVILTKKGSR